MGSQGHSPMANVQARSGHGVAANLGAQNGPVPPIAPSIQGQLGEFMDCDATRDAILKSIEDGSAPPMIKEFLAQHAEALGGQSRGLPSSLDPMGGTLNRDAESLNPCEGDDDEEEDEGLMQTPGSLAAIAEIMQRRRVI